MSDGRLGIAEAEHLVVERLGATARAAHSRFVGLVMGRLARERTVHALRGGIDGLGDIAGSLADIIGGISARNGMELGGLAEILTGLPRQN